MAHIDSQTGLPIPHSSTTDNDFTIWWNDLTPSQKILQENLLREDGSVEIGPGIVTSKGPTSAPNIFFGAPPDVFVDLATAKKFAKDNEIENPIFKPKGTGFIILDPSIDPPVRTFKYKPEAIAYAESIRANLVPVWDSKITAFRLETPPGSPIPDSYFDEDIGQFVLTLDNGNIIFKDPPPKPAADAPYSVEPIKWTDAVFVNDGHGKTYIVKKSEVAKPDFKLGDVEKRGGFSYIETSRGNFQRQPDKPTPGTVETIRGREFIRDTEGGLTPLAPELDLTLSQQIDRALASGNAEAALALADFRDRPTSLEAFNAAMQYAQSPGDVFSISNIARGVTPITAPEVGQTQRIALPPEFLQDSLSRVMNLFRGGAGKPNDFFSIISQLARSEKQAKQTAEEAIADQQKMQDKLDQRDLALNKALGRAPGEKRTPGDQAQIDRISSFQGDLSSDPSGLVELLTGTPSRVLDDSVIFSDLDPGGMTDRQIEFLNSFGSRSKPSQPTVPDVKEPTTFGGTSLEPGPGGTSFSSASREGEGNTAFKNLSESAQRVVELQASKDAPERFGHLGPSNVGLGEEDDFMAGGGVMDDNTAIVGEEGPELLIAQPGARVIPLKKGDIEKIRNKFGSQKMAHGGTLAPLLPFGLHQALTGGTVEPTRRRLSTAAGIPVLSGQARQNLLPEELDVFDRIRAESGIPAGAFAQEQRTGLPGSLIRRPSRFAPRVSR